MALKHVFRSVREYQRRYVTIQFLLIVYYAGNRRHLAHQRWRVNYYDHNTYVINLFVDNDGAVRCGYIGTIVLNDRITIATGAILPSLELQISIY